MMDFAKRIATFVKTTKESEQKIIGEVFRLISTQIISRTPIGDHTLWKGKPSAGYRPGTLVNSWHAGIGTPSGLSMREPNVTGATAMSEVQATSNNAAGNIAYLLNPAPYAIPIEYGHSTQAPNGMVRLAIQNYSAIVKKAAG